MPTKRQKLSDGPLYPGFKPNSSERQHTPGFLLQMAGLRNQRKGNHGGEGGNTSGGQQILSFSPDTYEEDAEKGRSDCKDEPTTLRLSDNQSNVMFTKVFGQM